MVQVRQRLAIEPMREADVPAVQEIERFVFSSPWPRNAYYRELSSRTNSYYVVLRRQHEDAGDAEMVGYAGMWRMHEEAHVTTIGVRHDLHHHGYGRVLFAGLVQAAYEMGARWVTLEVRATNENAQKMYEGFGFKVIGRRKGYYTDNGEDALVMWSDSIFSPRFRAAFEDNLAKVGYDVTGLRREPPVIPPAPPSAPPAGG